MPKIFSADSPELWAAGGESLEWARSAAEAFGGNFATFSLGEENDPRSATISLLRLPPNFVLLRHSHPCHRVEVIIKGSLRVGERVLGPGDVAVSSPDEAYGPHIAGPQGCTSVECFSTAEGIDARLDTDPTAPALV